MLLQRIGTRNSILKLNFGSKAELCCRCRCRAHEIRLHRACDEHRVGARGDGGSHVVFELTYFVAAKREAIAVIAFGKKRYPQITTQIMENAKDNGLLVGKGGLYGNVLRIAPPLSLTEAEADEGFDILTKAIEDAG